jgi:hypothetical protein
MDAVPPPRQGLAVRVAEVGRLCRWAADFAALRRQIAGFMPGSAMTTDIVIPMLSSACGSLTSFGVLAYALGKLLLRGCYLTRDSVYSQTALLRRRIPGG